MEHEYEISEQDYVNAMTVFARPTAGMKLAYASASAVFLLLYVSSPALRGLVLSGFLGGFGVLLACRFLVVPRRARSDYRSYPAIRPKIRVSFDEGGVHFATESSQGSLEWANIVHWRESEEYLLLYLSPRMFHIIPRRIARDGFDLALLLELLQQKLGPPI
jgi:hypothetical protein